MAKSEGSTLLGIPNRISFHGARIPKQTVLLQITLFDVADGYKCYE